MIDHKFKKKYGQNFLFDQNILNKIYNILKPNEDDLIIEIGPGSGNLTKLLKNYGATLYCFEIDKSLEDKLSIYEDDKTIIFYEDFLNVEIDKVINKNSFNNIYVIANIPYYITTPIIEKIMESNLNVCDMVLMVQKEVADRLSAKPGGKDYGYITALINCFYSVNKEFNVNRNCFYPVPNVDSAIIRLHKVNNHVKNFDKLKTLLQSAYRFKRKTIKNNLSSYNLELIESILKKYNLSLNSRAEEISIDIFKEIIDNL